MKLSNLTKNAMISLALMAFPTSYGCPEINAQISQSITIVKGTVVDTEGEPLIGASVMAKGSKSLFNNK